MPEKKHQTLTCSACGAPLDYDGKSPTVRCTFCNNVTLVEGYKEEQPAITVVEQPRPVPPMVIEIPPQPVARGFLASGGIIGCAVALVVLVVLGVIFGVLFTQPGGPFVPLLVSVAPATLLPGEGEAPLDVVSLFYDVNAEQRALARVGTSQGKLVWQADPLPGDGFVDGLATDGEQVYAASGDQLYAYRAADGSLAWQVEMPDRLEYSEYSLLVSGERVVVITLDRSLQAYDSRTGELAWERPLSGYDRQLRRMGERLVVMDYADEDTTYSLFFLDPADGSQQALLSPTCPYNNFSAATPDTDSGLLYDPVDDSLYIIYDSSPGCIQRLDLAGGQVRWQTLVEGWFSFSPYGFQGLLAGPFIYFQNENQLLAVEKASGMVRTLLADEDHEFLPLAVVDDTLIVRARRSRGSERFELWGMDASTGERRWSVELEPAKPLDPPNELVGLVDKDEPAWTWHLVPGGLMLLEFQAEPTRLVLKTLDPANGSSLSELSLELKKSTGDFYSVPEIIGWLGQVVYFNLDAKVYAVDTTSGEVLLVFQ